MMCVIWNLALVCLETVLVSVQEMWTVCAYCTKVLETIWKHLLVLQGEQAQVEARFGLFRDSANLDAR